MIRIFSDAKAPDATGADALEPTLIEVFETLRTWQAAGLLEDVNLTIKRLHQINSSDGAPDDAIITFDQLSDGEQMLLGRVALLHLVRGQDGALLLLDEPETHFNDVWKRELIDMIDDVILKETFAQVLVSTHTSIALTDVFSSEVVRLSWRDDRIVAESPAFPTFGADPGRILMHVLGSPEIIGRRAAEFLREKLRVEWRRTIATNWPAWWTRSAPDGRAQNSPRSCRGSMLHPVPDSTQRRQLLRVVALQRRLIVRLCALPDGAAVDQAWLAVVWRELPAEWINSFWNNDKKRQRNMKNASTGEMPQVDRTDWPRVRAMTDADISHDDDSPRTTAADWESAVLKQDGVVVGCAKTRGPNRRPTKEQVAVRYSPEVLAAFRATGRGWQTRMNEALKDWLKDHTPA